MCKYIVLLHYYVYNIKNIYIIQYLCYYIITILSLYNIYLYNTIIYLYNNYIINCIIYKQQLLLLPMQVNKMSRISIHI